jgi:hypothetical protein
MTKNSARDLIIELQGGLGNQLFQYQFANYLKFMTDENVFLSKSKIQNTNQNHPGNDITSLDLDLVIKERKLNLLSSFIYRVYNSLKIRSLIPHGFQIRNPPLYYPLEVGFDPELLSVVSDNRNLRIINGYFQSWRYGVHSRSILRDLFDQIVISNEYLLSLESRFRSSKVVVVHIRLGDYRLQSNAYIGILSTNYYELCLNYIEKNNIEMDIYVFSDEIDLAKSIFSEVFPEKTNWVKPVGEHDPIEVLKVMSLAGGFMIGNSSFSWWAAYMSENCEFVLAPTKWFKSAKDPNDLIPPSWNRIESDWNEIEQ